MSPRPSSTKLRRLTFDAHRYTHPTTGRTVMDCHVCGKVIQPATEPWECDHVTPRGLRIDDGLGNLAPICAGKGGCHSEKSKKDVSDIAKAKRVSDRHFGVKQSGSSFPCGKRSRWKKKLDGTVVERD